MRLSEAAARGFAKHESFFPRYGWFRKAYAAAAEDPRIFTREDAPAQIGVGKNMVNAIRFWGLAAKLIEEDAQTQGSKSPDIVPSSLGHALLGSRGWDPYVEDPGTLWLLHWLLLAPTCLIPVWWLAFNDFSAVEFTIPDMEDAVVAGLERGSYWSMPKLSSIKKDVKALRQTYVPPECPRNSDNLIYCPLRELELIVPASSDGRYRFKTGSKATLPSEIVTYAALDFIVRTAVGGGGLPLSQLAYEPGSPGRAFRLNEAELASVMEPIVDQTKGISLVTRTGTSHLVWWEEPAEIASAVLDEYYYRLWHGPDVDIRQLLDSAQQRVEEQSLADVLSSVDYPQPMVAARHSAQRDTLRMFSRRYVDASAVVEALGPFDHYDGEVLLVTDADCSPPRVILSGPTAKPMVAALPKDVSDLNTVAREISALSIALADRAVVGDRVARRQLEERRTRARGVLEDVLVATYGADSCRWALLGVGGTVETELAPGRGSSPLSEAADIAYHATPLVRNEMLNSHPLTRPGRSARRKLLEAMVEHGDRDGLGLDGFKAEVAMYRAFLKHTGLHRHDPDRRTWRFRRPTDESLQPAWEILGNQFRQARNDRVNLQEVHAALQSPPVGMKAGAVPVFITAGLLAVGDEVALYERGAFRSLTPELPQRMADHPDHFTFGSPPLPQG